MQCPTAIYCKWMCRLGPEDPALDGKRSFRTLWNCWMNTHLTRETAGNIAWQKSVQPTAGETGDEWGRLWVEDSTRARVYLFHLFLPFTFFSQWIDFCFGFLEIYDKPLIVTYYLGAQVSWSFSFSIPIAVLQKVWVWRIICYTLQVIFQGLCIIPIETSR